ncbi:MAG: pyridoxal-phosphate dependent enzyme [Calditrichaeota bacterium]|nr:pyridoxal-phosphate dependent enzyme [Calditrichota bacterium]MCB9391774.1 pyridoxal-phosphate dependent enzyme [Calditrichota bacterium]
MKASKEHKRLNDITEAIGNTPLVRLNKIGKGLGSEIWVKCEHMNPSGSVKDRIAVYMIEKAAREGELQPGGLIVENTSGNTGQGVAMVAAVKGYRCIFTMPDKMSQEKADGMKAYGAKVVVTPTNVPAESPQSYYETAKRIHRETPGSYYVNQYHNPVNTEAHYNLTGKEIWEQTEGQVTHVVAGVGTFGTFAGIAKYLKEKNPKIKCIAIDPMGSIFYSMWKTGKMSEPYVYKVEGMGEDMITGNMDLSLVDDMIQVDDTMCFTTARLLCREEGIMAGGSSGGAVYGALEVARTAPDGSVIVTILPDSGSRYLSKMFSDEWMRDNGFEDSSQFGTVHELVQSRLPVTLVCVHCGDKVGDVIGKMKENGISQLPVMDGDRVKGLIRENDLLKFLLAGVGNANSSIEPIIQSDFPTVTEDETLEAVSQIFTRLERNAVMVVRDGVPRDIITKIDLIDFLLHRTTHKG